MLEASADTSEAAAEVVKAASDMRADPDRRPASDSAYDLAAVGRTKGKAGLRTISALKHR